MSNDLLHNLRTAASLLATASTGAEKKSARAQRAAALVASAKGGIKPADAIEAAGLKNVSSYYDILRAAKNAGVTEAAKAIVVNRQTYIPKASLADEPRFANSPITQAAIRESEAASAEPVEQAVPVEDSRFRVRFRDADNRDRKTTVWAQDENAAREQVRAQYEVKRIASVLRLA